MISAETFEYLFKEKDVENRTKSGLLLLSKDLSNKYTFPVLIVRPKAMLSKNYVNVPHEIENEFLKLFGSYCTFQQGIATSHCSYKESEPCIRYDSIQFWKNLPCRYGLGIWENCTQTAHSACSKRNFLSGDFREWKKLYCCTARQSRDTLL